jgi:hypothetical protein
LLQPNVRYALVFLLEAHNFQFPVRRITSVTRELRAITARLAAKPKLTAKILARGKGRRKLNGNTSLASETVAPAALSPEEGEATTDGAETTDPEPTPVDNPDAESKMDDDPEGQHVQADPDNEDDDDNHSNPTDTVENADEERIEETEAGALAAGSDQTVIDSTEEDASTTLMDEGGVNEELARSYRRAFVSACRFAFRFPRGNNVISTWSDGLTLKTPIC